MKYFAFLMLELSLVSGCAISRPLSGPGYDTSMETLKGNLDRDVYIAITNAYLNRSKRSLFDKKTQEIYKTLNSYDGYLMGSVRLKILGKEVWTYTVWESKQSLDKFVNSRHHVDAIYNADPAIIQMRSLIIKRRAREATLTWKQIEELIEQEKMKDYKPL